MDEDEETPLPYTYTFTYPTRRVIDDLSTIGNDAMDYFEPTNFEVVIKQSKKVDPKSRKRNDLFQRATQECKDLFQILFTLQAGVQSLTLAWLVNPNSELGWLDEPRMGVLETFIHFEAFTTTLLTLRESTNDFRVVGYFASLLIPQIRLVRNRTTTLINADVKAPLLPKTILKENMLADEKSIREKILVLRQQQLFTLESENARREGLLRMSTEEVSAAKTTIKSRDLKIEELKDANIELKSTSEQNKKREDDARVAYAELTDERDRLAAKITELEKPASSTSDVNVEQMEDDGDDVSSDCTECEAGRARLLEKVETLRAEIVTLQEKIGQVTDLYSKLQYDVEMSRITANDDLLAENTKLEQELKELREKEQQQSERMEEEFGDPALRSKIFALEEKLKDAIKLQDEDIFQKRLKMFNELHKFREDHNKDEAELVKLKVLQELDKQQTEIDANAMAAKDKELEEAKEKITTLRGLVVNSTTTTNTQQDQTITTLQKQLEDANNKIKTLEKPVVTSTTNPTSVQPATLPIPPLESKEAIVAKKLLSDLAQIQTRMESELTLKTKGYLQEFILLYASLSSRLDGIRLLLESRLLGLEREFRQFARLTLDQDLECVKPVFINQGEEVISCWNCSSLRDRVKQAFSTSSHDTLYVDVCGKHKVEMDRLEGVSVTKYTYEASTKTYRYVLKNGFQ